jgi:hypothetical protein
LSFDQTNSGAGIASYHWKDVSMRGRRVLLRCR